MRFFLLKNIIKRWKEIKLEKMFVIYIIIKDKYFDYIKKFYKLVRKDDRMDK